MRDDIRAFETVLGIAPTDVVAHSLGGLVACLLAQQTPDLVRRLVLEDVPAPSRSTRPDRRPNAPTGTCRSTGP